MIDDEIYQQMAQEAALRHARYLVPEVIKHLLDIGRDLRRAGREEQAQEVETFRLKLREAVKIDD